MEQQVMKFKTGKPKQQLTVELLKMTDFEEDIMEVRCPSYGKEQEVAAEEFAIL